MRLMAIHALAALARAGVGGSVAQVKRLPVTADTNVGNWFDDECAAGKDRDSNAGADDLLELLDNREFMMASYDAAGVAGWEIESATLFLHQNLANMSQGAPMRVCDISTLAVPFNEGASHKGGNLSLSRGTRAGFNQASAGESTWNWRSFPAEAAGGRGNHFWAYNGSTFQDVTFSNGFTLSAYRHHDQVAVQPNGWTAIELPVDMVHALALGLHHGLVLSDSSQSSDLGGRKANYTGFLDVFVSSREHDGGKFLLRN